MVPVVIAAYAAPIVAEMSSHDKVFLDGLRKRNLLRLADLYLEDMNKTGSISELDAAEQQATLFEAQAMRASNSGQKNELLTKARQQYDALLKAKKDLIDKETDPRKQDQLRMAYFELKFRVADFIWSRQPGSDMDLLELTDRQAGDRQRAEQLMRDANRYFREIAVEGEAWRKEMDGAPDVEKRYLDTGLADKIQNVSAHAQYLVACTGYYVAYLIKTDSTFNVVLSAPGTKVPAVVALLAKEPFKLGDEVASAAVQSATPTTVAGGLSKEDADKRTKMLQDAGASAVVEPEKDGLLKAAAAKFEKVISDLDDTSPYKWDAYRMLGICNREQGLTDKAVEKLRKALEGSQDVKFKIRTYYELIQTGIMAGKFSDARAVMDELRSKHADALPSTFIGTMLLPFLDAKIALAEGQTDPQKKQRGIDILQDMYAKGILVDLVAAEIRKYVTLDPAKKLQPFELWLMAREATVANKYAEAEKYYLQYLETTGNNKQDPNYQEAIYFLAVGYYAQAKDDKLPAERRATLRTDAAKRFKELVDGFPNSTVADTAAQFYVMLRSAMQQEAPTAENLDAYDQAIDWFIKVRPEGAAKADMYWLSGLVKQSRKDPVSAAERFERVGPESPNEAAARFAAIECYRSDLFEKKFTDPNNKDLPGAAAKVVEKLKGYADWARNAAAKAQGDEAAKFKQQGAQAIIWAAQILVQDQVAKYPEGLELLARVEADFGKQPESESNIARIKFGALYAQNKSDEALAIIRGLVNSGQDVSDLLQKMLAGFTEDITMMIGQGKRDQALKKMAQADEIGGELEKYLDKKYQGVTDQKQKDKISDEITEVKLTLAMLHKDAGDFEGEHGAFKRLLALLGIDDPFVDPTRLEKAPGGLNLAYLTGLAESYQAATEVKDNSGRPLVLRDRAKSYDYLKRAVFYWNLIASSYQGRVPGVDPKDSKKIYWEARYNELMCCYTLHEHSLEQEFGKDPKTDYYELIRAFIRNMRAAGSDFGDKNMKAKFDSNLAPKVKL
jgi:tetratricopeptide (TPR) repeat protein